MQEYTHILMQLTTASPPYIPHDAPLPHACKQELNQYGYITPVFSGSLDMATSPLPSQGPHGWERSTQKAVDVVEIGEGGVKWGRKGGTWVKIQQCHILNVEEASKLLAKEQ